MNKSYLFYLFILIIIILIPNVLSCTEDDENYDRCKWSEENFLSHLEGEDLINAIEERRIHPNSMDFISDRALSKAIKEHGSIPKNLKNEDLVRALNEDLELFDEKEILDAFEEKLNTYNSLLMINDNPEILNSFLEHKFPGMVFEINDEGTTARIVRYNKDGNMFIKNGPKSISFNDLAPAKVTPDGCLISEKFGKFCNGEIISSYSEGGRLNLEISRSMISGDIDLTGVNDIIVLVSGSSSIRINGYEFETGYRVRKGIGVSYESANTQKIGKESPGSFSFYKSTSSKPYGYGIEILDGEFKVAGKEVRFKRPTSTRDSSFSGEITFYEDKYLLSSKTEIDLYTHKGTISVGSNKEPLSFYIVDEDINYYRAKGLPSTPGNWENYPCIDGERCFVIAEGTGVMTYSDDDIKLAASRNNKFFPVIKNNQFIYTKNDYSNNIAINLDKKNDLTDSEIETLVSAVGEYLGALTGLTKDEIEVGLRNEISSISQGNLLLPEFIDTKLIPFLESEYNVFINYEFNIDEDSLERESDPISIREVDPFPEGQDDIQNILSTIENTGLRPYVSYGDGVVDSRNMPIEGYEHITLGMIVREDFGGAKALSSSTYDDLKIEEFQELNQMVNSPQDLISAAEHSGREITIDQAKILYNSIHGTQRFKEKPNYENNEATLSDLQIALNSFLGSDLIIDDKYGMNTRTDVRSAGVGIAEVVNNYKGSRDLKVSIDPYASLLKNADVAATFDISGSASTKDMQQALNAFLALKSRELEDESYNLGLGIHMDIDDDAISPIKNLNQEELEFLSESISSGKHRTLIKQDLESVMGKLSSSRGTQDESAFQAASKSIESSFENGVFNEGSDNILFVHLDYDGSAPDKKFREVEKVNNLAKEEGVTIYYLIGGAGMIDGMPRVVQPEEITKDTFKINQRSRRGFSWRNIERNNDNLIDERSSSYLGVPLDIFFEIKYSEFLNEKQKLELFVNQVNQEYYSSGSPIGAGSPQIINP